MNDSTPKYQLASRRDKYGINKNTNYYRKNYELMTAPKINVLKTPVFDSLMFGISREKLLAMESEREDEFLAGYSTLVDTVTVPVVADTLMMASDSTMLNDSTMVADIPSDSLELDDESLLALNDLDEDEEEEKEERRYKYRYHPQNAFNYEQVYYNKYYGKLFIDDRPSPEELAEMQAKSDSIKLANKKPFFGLFDFLNRGKGADESDFTEGEEEESFDVDLDGETTEEDVNDPTIEAVEPEEVELEEEIED